jgi:hypothetical protein
MVSSFCLLVLENVSVIRSWWPNRGVDLNAMEREFAGYDTNPASTRGEKCIPALIDELRAARAELAANRKVVEAAQRVLKGSGWNEAPALIEEVRAARGDLAVNRKLVEAAQRVLGESGWYQADLEERRGFPDAYPWLDAAIAEYVLEPDSVK